MDLGITPYPGSQPTKVLALKPQAVRITVEALAKWTVPWVVNRAKEIRAAVPDCRVHLLLQERTPTDQAGWCREMTTRAALLTGHVNVYTLGNELGATKYWTGSREAYVPFYKAFVAAVRASDIVALLGAAGQTRGEVMAPNQNQWIAALHDYVDFWDLHLEGAPATIAEPIRRMVSLTQGGPVWVTELTGTLGAPLSQQERELPMIFAEAKAAGASRASYIPVDCRPRVYGQWATCSLLTEGGKERSTYAIMRKLIAQARAN